MQSIINYISKIIITYNRHNSITFDYNNLTLVNILEEIFCTQKRTHICECVKNFIKRVIPLDPMVLIQQVLCRMLFGISLVDIFC